MEPVDSHANVSCRNGNYSGATTYVKINESVHSQKNKKMSDPRPWLECDDWDYSSFLLDREANGLVQVQLGRMFTKPMANNVGMILASALIIRHKKTTSNGWCDGIAPSSELQMECPRKCEIRSGFRTGLTRYYKEEDVRNTRILDDAARLARIGLLMNSLPHPGPGDPQQPPPPHPDHGPRGQQGRLTLVVRGRPLVEVFAIRANFIVLGTIAIYDGKRGQIMYKNDRVHNCAPISNPEVFTDLVLTGPYRAIAADGESFAINVNPSGSDESVDDDGAMIWECSVNEGYEVVESSMATEGGDMVVTYAVLSDAVEATVQVNLVHFGDTSSATTHVYGKISAHIPAFDDMDNVLLFSRGAEDRVELVPSSAGSFVPLARSVIVLPVGSPLVVKVSLHATTPVHEDTPILFGGNLNFSFGEHTLGIRAAIGELSVRVSISSSQYREGATSHDIGAIVEHMSPGGEWG